MRRRARAAWIASRGWAGFSEVLAELGDADRRVDQCVHYGETVLWFEADVFDQMILVFLLARLRQLPLRGRISLVSVGAFPGVRRFIGLGQLTPTQLASLYPRRRAVTAGQWRVASEAWDAVRAPDPRRLSRIAARHGSALPFLPAALRRYLAEYPSTANGLGLTGQLALEAIARGATTAGEVFVAVQRRERRPFQGDGMLYAVLRDLGSGPRPAIEGRGPEGPWSARREVRLTETGRGLLAGRLDWCAVRRPTIELGGVTLRGARPRWRWDRSRQAIVAGRRG